MIATSPVIILDKHPCRETALVLRGISPYYGKIALMLHRAESTAGPAVDKYREVEVEFQDDPPKEIYTADRLETLTDFSGVADQVKRFAMAERIAAFILKNMPVNLPHALTYDTLRSVFSQLASADKDAWTLEQCAVVIKCVYLYENGLLPEGSTPQQSEFLENLVAAGIDNSELPQCAGNYWHSLNVWLNNLLDYQHLSR